MIPSPLATILARGPVIRDPWVIATLGHETGNFAPGVKSRAIAAQVSHHLLLSHGLALQALRAAGCRTPRGAP